MSGYRAKEHAMFMAMGEALSSWGKVEAQMIRLFAQATGMQPQNAAAVLSATNNAQVWMEMLNAAMAIRLREEALPEWQAIVSRIGDVKRRRNAVAHSQVIGVPPADATGYGSLDDCEPRVGLTMTSILALAPDMSKSLGLEDVKRLADDAVKLSELMDDFSRRVPGLCLR